MQHLVTLVLTFISIASFGQNLQTYHYGKNTLTRKVILKDLEHPVSGKTIRNAMVLELPHAVIFLPAKDDDDSATTSEIRIYGDVNSNIDPNIKYKNLIGKSVSITANYVFAPSGNYPLPVNIIEDFSYKIINKK